MTQINRISIKGFKSFANKTDIPFENKFNCILGPNGSGKSNIGDAICFVLGRLSAKSLRAEKASNLIFNGGKSKTPAKSGTVEIAFSNQNKIFPIHSPEVVISRTITSTGTSIYRINDKKCTRTEIVELLSTAKINPDGYNIILQGDITRFVDMSALERRRVIEEISDVAVYEEKKHKAILELNKVDEKLNNADIILKERKTYLKELKKDRDQALKFKELKDKINSSKATYVNLQMKDRQVIKDKYDQEINSYQQKINSAEKQIEELKFKINEQKESINKINQQIEQKGEKEQLRIHRLIEDLKVDITKDKARISTLKDEINKIKLRKDQLKEEIKDLEKKTSVLGENKKKSGDLLNSKRQEKQELENNISQFKKKHKIETSQELDLEIEDKDQLIEKKQEEVQKCRQSQQELLREKDRVEYQLQTIDERLKKVKEVEKENKEQIKNLQQFKNDFKTATLKLNHCLDQDSGFASQIANAKRNLAEIEEERVKLEAKNASIQAQLSSNAAVSSIIINKKKFEGVYGTIAELGQANKKYSLALETAAGGRMKHIVVSDDKVAAECIKYLKSNKLGSASFIPLNKIRYPEISSEDKKLIKTPGVHEFALNLVTYQPKFEKAFAYTFGNTLVVDDIDTARKVGIGRIKMTTIDGNAVESSGVMQGGFIAKKATLGFKEKDSLDLLEKLEGEISQSQGVISNLETKREANEKEISFLRNKRAELEAEVIKLEKSLHLDSGDLEANSKLKLELQERLKIVTADLDKTQRDISLINRDLANLKIKKQTLRTQVNELRNPNLLAQLSAFEESKQQCREQIIKLENELKNNQDQIEQMIAPEKEKIAEIMKQQEKEEVIFGEEIIVLTKKVTESDKDLKEKEKQSQEFYSKYKELFNQREKFSSEVNKNEIEIENIREKTRDGERNLNLVSLKNAEVKARLAGLEEEFSRFKGVELLSNVSAEELHREISKFEVMLAQMSAVNLKALEIYEQVEKEYNNLIEKKESLSTEKTDVLTLMNEIETKKKENFLKTFNLANENFSRIFSNLFAKGKAYLELDNNDNPFEDGLSIKVKLTGNRFMDIKSLSGGEKTLTALSFIFAIQEYQPASFYILDEIDAALDKHNAERLAKLVRDYSNSAQYILISHNDSVIAEADTLFGISMHEGVSKVTSLKI